MHSLMLISTGLGVGLTSTSLGLVRTLQRAGLKVGFFKPVAQSPQDTSSDSLMSRCHGLESPAPLSLSHVEKRLGDDQLDELLEELVSLHQQAAAEVDVVLIEGMVPSKQVGYANRFNSKLARSLDAQVILVSTPEQQTPEQLCERIEIQTRLLEGVKVAGVILNKVREPYWLNAQTLSATSAVPLLGTIPWQDELNAARTSDLVQPLALQILHRGELQQRRVQRVVLGACSSEYLVNDLQAGTFLVLPGDRSDLLLNACLASMNGVPLAGVLLCDNRQPPNQVLQLCQTALQAGLPLLSSERSSADLLLELAQLSREIPADDLTRAEQISDFVADRLSPQWFRDHCGTPHHPRLSPAAFRYQLIKRAQAANKRIVLPEGCEPRTVQAAAICQTRGIARCVLLAKPEQVHAVAQAHSITLPADLEIFDPESIKEQYVEAMVERRKSKGLNAPMARAQLEDSVVLGTMMLALDEVDGLVSGAIHTTANTIRPALQLIKTAENYNLVSSVFFMLLPDQVLVYGDCAVNPDPTAAELAEIALQSAHSAQAFGITPKVAMISYSTGDSGDGADVQKVREATRLAQSQNPQLSIDGPLQYDAAAVASVGQQKAPNSPVAGQATVYIFPDLNTGNTTYKAVQRSAHCVSVGPMLQGLRKPVNDLSRGALVDDIVFTIALTAIQADSQ